MRGLSGMLEWRRGVVLAALLLSACGGDHVKSDGPVTIVQLPPPTTIVVTDFAVSTDSVDVDNGIGGRLRRAVAGKDEATEQAQAAAGVRDSLRDALIASLTKMNLPARSAILGPGTPPYVEIRGTVTSIDEGNRTRRNLIGLGAGQSSVQAAAQAYYIAPGAAPVFLQGFQGDEDSGHMPGLAVGGAGAAAGHVAMAAANTGAHVATAGQSDTDAEAEQLGDDLAKKLGALFVQQGWIQASAIK